MYTLRDTVPVCGLQRSAGLEERRVHMLYSVPCTVLCCTLPYACRGGGALRRDERRDGHDGHDGHVGHGEKWRQSLSAHQPRWHNRFLS